MASFPVRCPVAIGKCPQTIGRKQARIKLVALGIAMAATAAVPVGIAGMSEAAEPGVAVGGEPAVPGQPPAAGAPSIILNRDAAAGEGGSVRFTESPDLFYATPNLTLSDDVSSYTNNSDSAFCLYEHINFQGEAFRVEPRTSGQMPPEWDNRASSVRVC
jgi:Peptidase inhibitor family I36